MLAHQSHFVGECETLRATTNKARFVPSVSDMRIGILATIDGGRALIAPLWATSFQRGHQGPGFVPESSTVTPVTCHGIQARSFAFCIRAGPIPAVFASSTGKKQAAQHLSVKRVLLYVSRRGKRKSYHGDCFARCCGYFTQQNVSLAQHYHLFRGRHMDLAVASKLIRVYVTKRHNR